MTPQFQNSPHQAARSPALTNSIPGTPNMNQALPMQNSQQYNYYPPHMPGPQVFHPSSSHQILHVQRPSNRGNKSKGWRKNDKASQNQLLSGQQRELYGHSYEHNELMLSERESFAHKQIRSGQPVPMEPLELRHAQQPQQDVPMLPRSSGRQSSTADDPDFPPVPPAFPCFSPSAVFPPLDASGVKMMDISPEGGGFDQFLTMRQQYGFNPQGYPDHRGMPMQQPPYMYPQMQFMNQPPQSPQPAFQQPNYIPGQYGPQPQSMSRNSSQMSEQRPASSMGQPQTPSMTPTVSHTHTPQPKVNSSSPSAFSRPTRKSAAILIKRPDGEALDLESLKAPASPAPRDRTGTPPVIASTPTATPPPKSSTPQHIRTDSAAVKTQEQVRLEVMEKVKKAAEATHSQEKADEAAKEAAETKAKEDKAKEERAKEDRAKAEAQAAEEAKAKEEVDSQLAADQAKLDEDEEMERVIREMEEAEAAREKKEAEILAKRNAEKAAAEKANAEKKKLEAEENDRKLKEQEREMERLEDERIKKRAEEEAKAQGENKSDSEGEAKKAMVESKEVSDDKNAPTTPSTLASKLSNLSIGVDSGTSTPASDDSMGPPPKVSATEKRGKPAALNLAPLNTKPVEPPQPSAALQSLKSARFLTVLNSSIYPSNISSPNPALNSAVTTKGKSFKYDKEFLLQFQKVFIEKPSMEFAEQVKNLIGDGDGGGSARSASTRNSASMGTRQGSNRQPPGAFAMGSFGAVGAGGKTLPPGTTSAERFAMSSGAMSRPPINPMASFNRPGGAFPGATMSRTPSSSAMNSMPHSPRQPSKSQRNNSRRDNYQPSNAKQEAQAAKTMPLTAGMDLKPIQVSATGWKPRSVGATQSATGAAGPAPGSSSAPGHMDAEMVQRKVKAALNKMTPEKFDKIADQILAIAAQSKDEPDGRTLRQVIQLTFEKATDEAHWASMYARFCKRMLETMSSDIKDESILDKNGNVVSGGNLFRKYLLNRCQEEFERGWKMDLPEKPDGEPGDAKETAEATMLSDEYYIAAAAKRRGLGLVQFIGELYKLSMLTERIMHECVKKLVDYTGIPDEAEIESLTKLLKTIGANLDSTEKGKPMMDIYFGRIQAMIDTPDLPSRLRFMLMDIVDLRKKNWLSKEANKGPKTLDEVRAEVCPKCLTQI
jgi:translation initiation factor 4G